MRWPATVDGGATAAVARLELLDGLRGRRQLVVRAITPLVLFGVVLGASLATRGADPVRTTPYRVAVEGDTAGAAETLRVLAGFNLVFEPTGDAPLAAARGADLGVRLPDRLDDRIARHETITLAVFRTVTSAPSRSATAWMEVGFDEIYRRQIDALSAGRGGAALDIITIDRINVQRLEQGTRELSAQIVPALLTLQAVMLVGSTATRILGRRNRGLLMAQLLLPVPRYRLAAAKARAELGLGMIAGSPVLLATFVYVGIVTSQRAGPIAATTAVGATAVAAVALALPMVALGLFIGTAARSQEQVTLGTAVALVVAASVAATTALGDFPRPSSLAVVPLVGTVSTLRDILNASGNPVWFAVSLVSSGLLAWGVTRRAGRRFDTDRVVLRIDG